MSFLSRFFGRNEQNNDAQEADLTLIAPVTGSIIPLSDVPDPVISEKIAGDGCAFIPEGCSVYAPCDGTITRVLSSGSAVTLRTESGTEIYLRIGIGNALLNGDGFSVLKKEGDVVRRADELLSFDLSRINDPGKSSITTMIVINSSARILKVTSASGHVSAGTTPCAWVYYD